MLYLQCFYSTPQTLTSDISISTKMDMYHYKIDRTKFSLVQYLLHNIKIYLYIHVSIITFIEYNYSQEIGKPNNLKSLCASKMRGINMKTRLIFTRALRFDKLH
jgi:hypothetical protein